jgi:hypothetical protein
MYRKGVDTSTETVKITSCEENEVKLANFTVDLWSSMSLNGARK